MKVMKKIIDVICIIIILFFVFLLTDTAFTVIVTSVLCLINYYGKKYDKS